jgi:drug/metabolite transporter (DMT)-like permease
METNLRKGTALALMAAVISGFSVFANGVAVKLADPVAYTVLKNAGAFVFLAALLIAARDIREIRQMGRKQWLTLALIGVIGGSVPFAMFFIGLSHGGAAVSSFIYRSLFIFAGVFGYLILKEEPKPADMAAAFAILIGNALLVSGDAVFGTGQMLVLGATVLWALEYTISRKAMSGIRPRTVMAARMLFGAVVLVAFMGASGSLGVFASISAPALGWLALTSLSLGAFLLAWYSALKFMPVFKAACIFTIGGVVTIALESLFLGRAVSLAETAGIFLVLSGASAAAYLASASPRQAASGAESGN